MNPYNNPYKLESRVEVVLDDLRQTITDTASFSQNQQSLTLFERAILKGFEGIITALWLIAARTGNQ